MKIYAIFLLALILILLVANAINLVKLAILDWRIANVTLYEDGSYTYTHPYTLRIHTGCFFPMGCAMLGDFIPALDEEWMDSNEHTIGGPLVQDGTIVLSGFDHTTHWTKFYPNSGKRYKETYWNCFHALPLCFLRHDDRPMFYRIMPEFPPFWWEWVFGPQGC